MSTEWLDWHGCYDDGWKGLIVDEAFAHPAKAARGLVRRIFAHMESQGWLPPRSRVLDVFGGIGTTAIEGASRGHEVVLVELEERFVNLARQNFELHRRVWEASGDPLPVILHGDSRKAVELVRGHFAGCVGSPPYAETPVVGQGNFQSAKCPDSKPGREIGAADNGYDAVVGSPPYADSDMNSPVADTARQIARRDATSKLGYGESGGQLGAMKEGDADGVVGSPPYEGNTKADYLMSEDGKTRARDERRGYRQGTGCFRGSEGAYGQSPGQLGIEQAETFWSAAREILLQVHLLLKPQGVCAWICKDYVKAGKRVPFCDNWARLCEACGFTVVQRARCHLVKEETNPGLFGDVTKKTERKSFFRRLHERKPGAVKIDFEEVIFAVKEK